MHFKLKCVNCTIFDCTIVLKCVALHAVRKIPSLWRRIDDGDDETFYFEPPRTAASWVKTVGGKKLQHSDRRANTAADLPPRRSMWVFKINTLPPNSPECGDFQQKCCIFGEKIDMKKKFAYMLQVCWRSCPCPSCYEATDHARRSLSTVGGTHSGQSTPPTTVLLSFTFILPPGTV